MGFDVVQTCCLSRSKIRPEAPEPPHGSVDGSVQRPLWAPTELVDGPIMGESAPGIDRWGSTPAVVTLVSLGSKRPDPPNRLGSTAGTASFDDLG